MPRTISSDLATILADPTRKMNWTLVVTLPDTTILRYATAPLTISGNAYANDLESVREIRQSIGGPIDRVGVALQNKDGVLGLAVAADPDLWRRAEAVIGRHYKNIDGTLTAWKQMFSGTFQQPMVKDLQVTTDIISDVASAGLIVCSRSCALNCPFKFKHAATCGYSGGLTTCNHLLKSPDGCDGRSNNHHFGGTEHRYPVTQNVPGSGGNGDIDPPPYCPRVDQWLTVRAADGVSRRSIRAGEFRESDWLWDPIEQAFFPTRTARLIEDVPIWYIAAANGSSGHSSYTHRVMPDVDHETGIIAHKYETQTEILVVNDDAMTMSYCTRSEPTGEVGDVMFIEMEAGHHYEYGDDPENKIVAHNSKPLEDI